MKQHKEISDDMSAEYNFADGKRGAVVEQSGKTRITMWVDTEVLHAFRCAAEVQGRGYQTAMNDALKAALKDSELSLEDRIDRSVRAAVREELQRAKFAA